MSYRCSQVDQTSGVQFQEEEKKFLQRELSSWSKKIPLLVGFEAVAEALLGHDASVHFLLGEEKQEEEEEDEEEEERRRKKKKNAKNWDHSASDGLKKDVPVLLSKRAVDAAWRNTLADLDCPSVDIDPTDMQPPREELTHGTDMSLCQDSPLDLRKPEKIFNQNERKRRSEETNPSEDSPVRGGLCSPVKIDPRRWSTAAEGFTGRFRDESCYIGDSYDISRSCSGGYGDQQLRELEILDSAAASGYLPSGHHHPFNSDRRDLDLVRNRPLAQSRPSFQSTYHGYQSYYGSNPGNGQQPAVGKGAAKIDENGNEHSDGEKIFPRAGGDSPADPSGWKSEPLDYERTEVFESLTTASSEGSTSAEEGQDLSFDRSPGSGLFQSNDRIERLLVSVITKNILEKYRQVRDDRGAPTSEAKGSPESELSSAIESKFSSSKPPVAMMSSSQAVDANSRPRCSLKEPSLRPYPEIPAGLNSLGSYQARTSVGYPMVNLPRSSVGSSTPSGSNLSSGSTPPNGKKSRPKRGQYRRYNRQLLLEAVRAVQQGNMSVHRAGSYFGVPHSTLEYKVKERHLLRNKKSGQDQRQRSNAVNCNNSISSRGGANGLQGYGVERNVPTFPGHPLFPGLSDSAANPREGVPLLQNMIKCLPKDPEVKDARTGPTERGNGFQPYPVPPLPLFYPGIFDGLSSPYGWLAARFPKSPMFPPSGAHSAVLNAFFPLGFQAPSPGMEQFNPASELLRQLNSKVQADVNSMSTSVTASSSSSSKSPGNNDDLAEPHSTSSLEIDLRTSKASLGD